MVSAPSMRPRVAEKVPLCPENTFRTAMRLRRRLPPLWLTVNPILPLVQLVPLCATQQLLLPPDTQDPKLQGPKTPLKCLSLLRQFPLSDPGPPAGKAASILESIESV